MERGAGRARGARWRTLADLECRPFESASQCAVTATAWRAKRAAGRSPPSSSGAARINVAPGGANLARPLAPGGALPAPPPGAPPAPCVTLTSAEPNVP